MPRISATAAAMIVAIASTAITSRPSRTASSRSGQRGGQEGDITILLPDEVQGDVFRTQIRDNLRPATSFSLHGFNYHSASSTFLCFGFLSPQGAWAPGPREYARAGAPRLSRLGKGPAMVPADRPGLRQGIGGTRAGVIETTFAEETETDLSASRSSSAADSALIKAGYETLSRPATSRKWPTSSVCPRSQADRRPDLPGRPELRYRSEHGRVRRLQPRSADRHRPDEGRDEETSPRKFKTAASPGNGFWKTRPTLPPSRMRRLGASTLSKRSAASCRLMSWIDAKEY